MRSSLGVQTASLPDTVTTRAGLLHAGHHRGLGDEQVQRGERRRVAPSVYLAPGAALVDRVLAALAHTGEKAVVTGWAGCQLLGLRYAPSGDAVPVLTAARGRRTSTAWVQVLPTTRPPGWRWVQRDIRVARPERCIVDAARQSTSSAEVRGLVLAAIHDGRTTEAALRTELDAGARNGSALCRLALDDARRGAASCPEAEVAGAVAGAGVRGFLLNPAVRLGGTLLGYPDGWVVGLGLGWEVESREFHSDEDPFEATLVRHDGFGVHGLLLLHATPRHVRRVHVHYGLVVAEAVRSRRASGYREPEGLVVVPTGPLLPLSARRLRLT